MYNFKIRYEYSVYNRGKNVRFLLKSSPDNFKLLVKQLCC